MAKEKNLKLDTQTLILACKHQNQTLKRKAFRRLFRELHKSENGLITFSETAALLDDADFNKNEFFEECLEHYADFPQIHNIKILLDLVMADNDKDNAVQNLFAIFDSRRINWTIKLSLFNLFEELTATSCLQQNYCLEFALRAQTESSFMELAQLTLSNAASDFDKILPVLVKFIAKTEADFPVFRTAVSCLNQIAVHPQAFDKLSPQIFCDNLEALQTHYRIDEKDFQKILDDMMQGLAKYRNRKAILAILNTPLFTQSRKNIANCIQAFSKLLEPQESNCSKNPLWDDGFTEQILDYLFSKCVKDGASKQKFYLPLMDKVFKQVEGRFVAKIHHFCIQMLSITLDGSNTSSYKADFCWDNIGYHNLNSFFYYDEALFYAEHLSHLLNSYPDSTRLHHVLTILIDLHREQKHFLDTIFDTLGQPVFQNASCLKQVCAMPSEKISNPPLLYIFMIEHLNLIKIDIPKFPYLEVIKFLRRIEYNYHNRILAGQVIRKVQDIVSLYNIQPQDRIGETIGDLYVWAQNNYSIKFCDSRDMEFLNSANIRYQLDLQLSKLLED